MAGCGDDAGLTAYATAARLFSACRGDRRGPAASYIYGTYAMRFPGQPTGGLAQERAWP